MLFGFYEFRGKEEKTSKNGNNYCNLQLEDIENGSAISVFCNNTTYNAYRGVLDTLEKGDNIKIIMNYYFNTYERKNMAVLTGVERYDNE